MGLAIGMVTIDTTDAIGLATWWAHQLGGTTVAENDGFFMMVSMGEGSPMMGFQKVDDPTPGKNRVHLDLNCEDRDVQVARCEAAGATRIGEYDIEGYSWITLADPDGNRFCVSTRH